MFPGVQNVRWDFGDTLDEASLDVLDIVSDFVDRVADKKVEARLP